MKFPYPTLLQSILKSLRQLRKKQLVRFRTRSLVLAGILLVALISGVGLMYLHHRQDLRAAREAVIASEQAAQKKAAERMAKEKQVQEDKKKAAEAETARLKAEEEAKMATEEQAISIPQNSPPTAQNRQPAYQFPGSNGTPHVESQLPMVKTGTLSATGVPLTYSKALSSAQPCQDHVHISNMGDPWTEPDLSYPDRSPDNSYAFSTSLILGGASIGKRWDLCINASQMPIGTHTITLLATKDLPMIHYRYTVSFEVNVTE